MRHNYHASFQNVRIRPVEKSDIEELRIWRNDNSKTKFLRRINKITPLMQEQWFESYLKNQDEIIFAIDETDQLNKLIGSLALYNFNGKVAEIGKLQIGETAAWGNGLGGKSFVMAMKIGFEKLGLEKIMALVHRENIAAYKSYMKIGFRVVGNHPAPIGGIEDEIEIDWQGLKAANSYVTEIEYKR